MGFMTNVAAGFFGPSEQIGGPDNWLMRALGIRSKAGVTVSEYSAMHMPAVYSAVGVIADNFAQVPVGVFRQTPRGAVQDTSHPIAEALRSSPNPYSNSFTWRQTTMHHALLWGNGYTEIQRNNRGQAMALWQMLPDRTRPIYENEDRGLYYQTNVGGRMFDIQPDDMLHIKAIGYDGLIGYAPLTMMRQAVGLGLAMEEFGSKFFANDAKSGGFLMHPGRLGVAGKKNLADSMGKEGQGGLDNAHRVKVLEEGTKFIPTMIPPEDAQFLGSRSFQVEEIARIYRVPLVLMNSHEKTSVIGSSMEQLLLYFVLLTIQPWIVQAEMEMNRKLFTPAERKAGYFVRFNLDALQRGDMAARATYLKSMWGIGAISPNEARTSEGRNTKPGLDDTYVPINYQTVKQSKQPKQPSGVVSAPGANDNGGSDSGEQPADDTND